MPSLTSFFSFTICCVNTSQFTHKSLSTESNTHSVITFNAKDVAKIKKNNNCIVDYSPLLNAGCFLQIATVAALEDDESDTQKRRVLLSRRPSYRWEEVNFKQERDKQREVCKVW